MTHNGAHHPSRHRPERTIPIRPPPLERERDSSAPLPELRLPHRGADSAPDPLEASLQIADIGTTRHPVSTPPTAVTHRPRRNTASPIAGFALALGVACAVLLMTVWFRDMRRPAAPTTRSAAAPVTVTLDPVFVGPPLPGEQAVATAGPSLVESPPGAATERLQPEPGASPARSQPEAPVSAAPIDVDAALGAVEAARVMTPMCGSSARGAAQVTVTFAPSGRATHAVIEDGPLRGTPAGSCIARQLRGLAIAPFQGERSTVQTTLTFE